MIEFTENGEEFYFNPEEKDSDYRGENEELISILSSIESLAYKRVAPEEQPEGVTSVPENRVYDPNEAEAIVRSAIQRIDGVQLLSKGKPQVVDRRLVRTVDGRIVKRNYVEDPSEVPPGVTLHEGDRGGLYYDDDSGDFAQMQIDTDMERMEEYEFTDDQIQEGVETLTRIESKANDIFEDWFEFATEAGNPTGATHRTKSVGSALEKVYDRKPEKYDSVEELDDLHGSMIKFDSIEECDEMFNAIQESDEINVVEAEDKYGSDGPYRAQHIIADVDGDTVELQIKQEDLSDIASASHTLSYKPETAPIEQMDTLDEPADEPLQEELDECLAEMSDYIEGINDDIACSDRSFDIIEEFFQLSAS